MLEIYRDADYAGRIQIRIITSEYLFKLRQSVIFWTQR